MHFGGYMNKKTLALNLLELRQSRSLTQKQLCEDLNIGRSTYSYFETGSRIPDIETLLQIARYYHVSLDELTGSGLNKNMMQESNDATTEQNILRHLKSKHIPIDDILQLTKADFDFLKDYKALTDDNKAEMQYLMNYKLRKQD